MESGLRTIFSEILEILEAKDFRLEYFYQVRRLGSVLATGDKFVPIKLIFANQELPEEAIDLINRVSVRIWYRSIYGIEHRRFSQLLPE